MGTLLRDDWHAIAVGEVGRLLNTDLEGGLGPDVVSSRMAEYGPNKFDIVQKKNPLWRFVKQFHNSLVYILLGSSVITAFLGQFVDAVVIFGVTFVNAVIGFVQESKAEAAVESLKKLVISVAKVFRGGVEYNISSEDLVPGDVVLLTAGDKVPADIRLDFVRGLFIDESVLTGESVSVEKSPITLPPRTQLHDRRNMAYAGTLVVAGKGRGVVVATGANTEVGKIASLISSDGTFDTPLTKKMALFSKKLLYVILGLSAITFVVGLFHGRSAFDMFLAAVALAVGAIPEGLPAAVTITLAIGVGRMAKRRAIVRNLPAVETLGSTTVICTDKTGTLTENKMSVVEIYAGGRHFSVGGSGYDPVGKIVVDGLEVDITKDRALFECLMAGVLCNDSRVEEQGGEYVAIGDPTEAALLVAAAKGGLDRAKVDAKARRIDVIPFGSDHQLMATLHEVTDTANTVVFVKGSVEKVLGMCSGILQRDGTVVELDVAAVMKEAEVMAANGLRVLAFARGLLRPEHRSIRVEDITGDLTFLGLQAMLDPPRAEAVAAVKTCLAAGISVKMMTGDHKLTARNIAIQVGLDSDPKAISGVEMESMNEEEFIAAARDNLVFARVTPEQKLRLVNALHKLGHIVAMTGDGVNDAPALKEADIGVAMGRSGTEVAKEAADIILTDDNFASIEAAVEEGRGVFDNIIKFIVWTLPTNLGEGFVILVATFTGAVLPILPVQILWINMTTAVLLGLMLAFEPKEKDVMKRKPRDPKKPLLTKSLVFDIVLVGSILLVGAFFLFRWALSNGMNEAAARTVAVNVFVIVEMFYLFNCRSLKMSIFKIGFFSNKWAIAGSLLMLFLQILYTYTPLMNKFFKSAPIDGEMWVRIGIVGIASYIIVASARAIKLRLLER